MGKRKLICRWCRGKDTDDYMVIVKDGKQNKRYHKEACYDEYIADQEFKRKEREEMDELVETIKEVHDIKLVPNQFYSYLQDLRNGNELFGNVGKKRSKEGYPYRVIAQTYRECQGAINWARDNREFNGSLNFLRYTRAIIVDKIDEVHERVLSRERQEEEITEVDQSGSYELDTFTYKEKDDEMDISDML